MPFPVAALTRRRLWLPAAVLVLCVSACGAGPSVRPDVAVVERGDGATAEPTGTQGPPALAAPVHDLNWQDCTRTTLDVLGLGPGPAGLVLECAELAAPIDAGGRIRGSFSLGALRARLPQTPADAAPLVLTSGADRSSTSTLAALAAGPAAPLLAARPLVAVDRRGIGTSTPIECLAPRGNPTLGKQMFDLGQFTAPPVAGGDAVDTVMALGRDATTECTDFLQPQELAFDAAHAADDLEQLRTTWGVDRLGLLATGSGGDVALAFAAKHPGAVARLVLDSPATVRADAVTVAETRVRGQEAALAAFARQCAALACALGPDPHAAVLDLIHRAGAGQLRPISTNALGAALTDFLGSPRGDQQARIREFADVLAAAGRGDTAGLSDLVGRAASATDSDGQFVARCSDGQQWPTPGRVRELQRDWGERYPAFGPDAALSLLLCASWPTTAAQPTPSALSVPVLTIAGAADPVAGDGAASASGAVAAAGAPSSTLAWLGRGHPASSHSECVQQAVVTYVGTGTLPPDGGACPG
ncbi:alpha/beta hydrolase [Rhodococcus spelaei]|uniref:Alpha/beta hydrolase n=1 Tax=Rhodococcus spelaei TaxID=2546320 RepID=A0A541B1W6_9NOCA|nr:alpha/beta hydrolase [Rhodococcus spelaei]TQF66322.1 alpha/beta hydrolase [Rhodococcus spelaei]